LLCPGRLMPVLLRDIPLLVPHSFPTRRSSDLIPSRLPADLPRRIPSKLPILLLRQIPSKLPAGLPHPLRSLWKLPAPEASTETRSEEHTSELQSRFDLVCRLLLEKKTTS